jgi:hypothetical protein
LIAPEVKEAKPLASTVMQFLQHKVENVTTSSITSACASSRDRLDAPRRALPARPQRVHVR